MYKKGDSKPDVIGEIVPVIPHPISQEWEKLSGGLVTTPDDATQWLRALDFTEYVDSLSLLNGVLRGLPPERHGISPEGVKKEYRHISEDGNKKRTGIYIAPYPSARYELLQQLYQATRHLDAPEVIGEMHSVVLAEGQFYGDANSRLAREMYLRGIRTYCGTRREQMLHGMAVYNMREDTNINFGGIHTSLASSHAKSLATGTLKKLGIAPGIEVTTEMPDDLPRYRGFGAQDIELARLILSEDHFNVPLVAGWIEECYSSDVQRFLDNEGNLSAHRVMGAFTPETYRELIWQHMSIKTGYVSALISAFRRGGSWLSGKPPIREYIAPFLPPQAVPAWHLGRIAMPSTLLHV